MVDGWRHGQTGNVALRTTRWSLVRRAAGGGVEAVDEWATACWYPLYAWARRRGCQPEDAADAVQDFLAKVCTRGLLAQVDPARGRLRSWLLTGFSNHLASHWKKETRRKQALGRRLEPAELREVEALYHGDMAGRLTPNGSIPKLGR